jgi:predicted transposase YbfD/YdcC
LLRAKSFTSKSQSPAIETERIGRRKEEEAVERRRAWRGRKMKHQRTLSIKRLRELSVKLADTRRQSGNIRHKLMDVLSIVLLAVVSGYSQWEEIYQYAESKTAWLIELFKLEHGIPSVSTIRRVISIIKPETLEEIYREWVIPYVGSTKNQHLAVDGKTACGVGKHKGHKLHTLSVWATEHGISLGQRATDAKSNEITAIPQLLNDLDIEGGIISIDAMGCQKEIAENIRNNKADYVLAVKKNQKTLFHDAIDYFAWAETDATEARVLSHGKHKEWDHGRSSRWRAVVTKEIKWFESCKGWKDLTAIVMIEKTTEYKGKTTVERRYYISSLDVEAEKYMQLIREHWLVENSLHWVLDAEFDEDDGMIHTGNAPKNMSLIRKFAMIIMKSVKTPGLSYNRIQIMAALNNDFIASLFA